MGRTLLGAVAGAVAMWITVFALEFTGHALYPPPPGLNPQEQADLAAIIVRSPPGALTMLVLAWVAGAFTGGYVAARIARPYPRAAAVFVALLVMAGVVGMIVLVPQHPVWVAVLGLVLPVPAAMFAARLAKTTTQRA